MMGFGEGLCDSSRKFFAQLGAPLGGVIRYVASDNVTIFSVTPWTSTM